MTVALRTVALSLLLSLPSHAHAPTRAAAAVPVRDGHYLPPLLPEPSAALWEVLEAHSEQHPYKDGAVLGWIAPAPTLSLPVTARATFYHPSLAGGPLGCGYGPYRPSDPTVVAVSPARYREWPCGTEFQITGPAGSMRAMRKDACPGCSANHVDLSSAGSTAVCGRPVTCTVQVRRILP